MPVSFDKQTPIYQQVIQDFTEKIASGELEPGQEIMSRRELAGHLGINPNTVQRAYKEMEEAGLIYTEGNSPSRITDNPDTLKSLRKTLIQQTVDDFVTSIRSAKLPSEEIISMIQEKLTHEDK